MKKLAAIFASLIVITSVFADNLWFGWTPNPPLEMVTGYQIQYKKLPAVTNWTYLTFVPGTTNVAIITGVQPGFIYQFRAFAANAIGVGTNLSNVVQVPTNAPSAVSNFNLTTPH